MTVTLNPTTEAIIATGASTAQLRFAAVMPVYNHAAKAARVMAQLRAEFPDLKVVVVDDGSTDNGLASMERADIERLRHPENKGKGAALQTGFAAAAKLGATHVITIDADGQHHVPDVESLMAAAERFPEDLIVGRRDLSAPHIPESSRKGQLFSQFWIKLQTGQDVPDSQCGLRVYPLKAARAMRCWFKRYDFETEIITRLAWAGLRVYSVNVACIYFTGTDRVSHYRPLRDNFRGVRVNVMLVCRRLLPIPVHKLVHHVRPEVEAWKHSWWKPRTWKAAAREILLSRSTNSELATAISVGVMIAVLPIYPLQTVMVAYVARRLHLNLIAALLGSQFSFPPFIPVLLLVEIQTGHLLLHGSMLPLDLHEALKGSWWSYAGSLALGGLVWALLIGTAALLISRGVLKRWRKEPPPVHAAEAT